MTGSGAHPASYSMIQWALGGTSQGGGKLTTHLHLLPSLIF